MLFHDDDAGGGALNVILKKRATLFCTKVNPTKKASKMGKIYTKPCKHPSTHTRTYILKSTVEKRAIVIDFINMKNTVSSM